MDSRKTNGYEDLTVWQLAMDLAVDCHRLSKQFPSIDRSGFEASLFQTAMLLPEYIADAHARSSSSVYLENISLALGTVARVETCILLAERMRFCNGEQRKQIMDKLNSVRWLLVRLRNAFNRRGISDEVAVS
jgi:four helix bundle protein